ncbi:amine oxidase catalytic domain-containing protein [Lentithecium fluviatile CBS 122367]|uniref:Amine oxidase n=1 Tax=Lentithecium fluviatile CBS 122367 TaxID=1168545 RepID=A0A6G1J4A8_9PLEO|nr:amine oxidase catalytic domain-containing protein [Lentithecium fluviatile CBS 122367]
MKHALLFTAISIANFAQYTIQDCVQCFSEQPVIAAPHANIWQPLSDEELLGVNSVLSQKLNLTSSPDDSGRDNQVLQIDLLQPNKTAVLPFLSGTAGEPKRYARATIQFGSFEKPYLQEYLVGPLPASNATSVQPLSFPFNNDKKGKSRIASIYTLDVQPFIAQLSEEIEDITQELWSTTILEGGVLPRTGTVEFDDNGNQILWATLLGPSTTGFDSVSALPLGVFVRLDVTSRDWQEWSITAWYSQGKLYDSTDAFREAVFSSNFEKPPPNLDGPWMSTDKQGESLPLDDLPPPITVSEGKKRFSVDMGEQYVSWMDFGFFLSTSTDQGLSLFAIHYKGTKIIYELALQEALAHYAGADPAQSETLYFDSQGGMGRTMVPLVKGYDCPIYATFLNATWTSSSGATTVPNSICLFEADANYPIRRHHAIAQEYTSVARNIVFTVRWISTVGNYDYLFDYNFYYDGSIEISVRASGYISAAYFAGNEEYGFKIHDFLSGSLHDHVMNFKVDMDILGEMNSVQKVEIVSAAVEYPWSEGQTRNTMKLEKSFLSSEDESSITWAPNDAVIYAIVNKDSPNKYGEYPGYRVKRSGGATHLIVKNSTNAGRAIHYATSDFFVTKQKDTEPRSADRNNNFDNADPLVDFSKFLDKESLEQEDLVLWVNLGMHHAPHTGDLPNTLMTSAHSAIRIEPFNYLLGDPSIAISQQIRVNRTSGEVERFDAQAANCSVDLSTLGEV